MIKKIRELRRAKGWTQNDLAERSGYSRSSIINWETGKRAPRTVDIEQLAITLGVSPSDFLNDGSSGNNQVVLQNATETHNNQDDVFAYWGGVLDNARKVAKSKDIQEIALITPLLRSALGILLSAQEHEYTADDVVSGVSAFNGNHSSYNGNTVSVGAKA